MGSVQITGGCCLLWSVLHPRSCKCSISREWSGFTQRRREWVSGWNSSLQDTGCYGLCSEAMSRSIDKVQLSVSVTLYVHPGNPLRMTSVDFIKWDFSLPRSSGNLERQKYIFSRSLIKHDSWFGRRSRALSASRTCGKQWLLLVWLWCWLNPCPHGKSDQQKPKGNQTLAFNELVLLKPKNR